MRAKQLLFSFYKNIILGEDLVLSKCIIPPMAYDAVRSKALVLLLFGSLFIGVPIVRGVLCLVFVLLCIT